MSPLLGVAAALWAPAVVGYLAGGDLESRSVERGVRLAIEQARPPPRLVVRRPSGDPWRQISGALVGLVSEANAELLLGSPESGRAHLEAQVATKLRVPLVSFALEPALTRSGVIWLRRPLPDARAQARALATYLRGRRGAAPTVAALAPSDRDGGTLLSELVRAIEAEGGRVEPRLRYPPGRPIAPALLSGLPAGVEALALLGEARQMGRALHALRPRRPALRVIGTSRLDAPRFLATAGPAAEGVVLVRLLDPATLGDFVRRFRARFDAPPDGLASVAYQATARALQGRLSDAPVPPTLAIIRGGHTKPLP